MVHLSLNLLKYYHRGFVCIRFALGGCTNRPFYKIVAAHNKRARDGKFLEQLGSYDPMPNVFNEKLVSLNLDRVKYWLGCGAQMTKPVSKLLGLSGFFPLHPMTVTGAERFHKEQALMMQAASQQEPTSASEDEQPIA